MIFRKSVAQHQQILGMLEDIYLIDRDERLYKPLEDLTPDEATIVAERLRSDAMAALQHADDFEAWVAARTSGPVRTA